MDDILAIEDELLHIHSEPFRWDEVRRAQIRAELDAYYARLYGLTRDELRHTLRVDSKEVHGEDFPGETFRVLKEKEVKQLGDAPRRTKIPFEYGEYNVLVNSPY